MRRHEAGGLQVLDGLYPPRKIGGGGGPAGPATPVGVAQKIVWTAGQANPDAQNVTIDASADGFAVFGSYYHGSTGQGLDGATLAPNGITLGGAAPDFFQEALTDTGDQSMTYVAVWFNPPTGTVSLDIAQDQIPAEGPICIGHAWSGGAGSVNHHIVDNNTTNGSAGGTINTAADALVLVLDQHFHAGGTAPTLQSGWSDLSGGTQSNASEAGRLRYIVATGSTVTVTAQDLNYSTIAAISILAGA